MGSDGRTFDQPYLCGAHTETNSLSLRIFGPGGQIQAKEHRDIPGDHYQRSQLLLLNYNSRI